MIEAQATAYLNRQLASKGFKAVISVSKLKEMGFKPAMELPQAVYWHKVDLEKAAETLMKELSQKAKSPAKADRLEKIELMLNRICKELNIKE